MSDVTRPALSIVMLTPGSFEMIRRTVAYLAAQDVHDTLELVIVAPSARDLGLDRDAVSAFWRTTVVEVRAMRRTAEGKAAGVRGASAPYVAFAEEHSWPAPGWARARIFDVEFDRWKHLARGDRISDEAIGRSVSSAPLPREGR